MKEFNVLPDDKSVLALLKKINRFDKISDQDLQLFIGDVLQEYPVYCLAFYGKYCD
ncbi:MAG: hypothetical protein OEY01_11680 [Desulfobulbaceae bacterium]|nr:hypothetical protein [Desulfobulbaceae bacterium]